MVKIYEYQGKEVLEREGLQVPKRGVAKSPEEAEKIAKEIGKTVVLKAQILATGRLKAGAIKFAENPREARIIAEELLGKNVKGFTIEKVLVEETVDIERELFLSIIVNDSYKVRGPEILLSLEGGIDIEQLAKESPEKIGRLRVDYSEGINVNELTGKMS